MRIFIFLLVAGLSLPALSATDPFDTSGPVDGSVPSGSEIRDLRMELEYLKSHVLKNNKKDSGESASEAAQATQNTEFTRIESFMEVAGKFFLKLPAVASGAPRYVEVSKKTFLAAKQYQDSVTNNNNNNEVVK